MHVRKGGVCLTISTAKKKLSIMYYVIDNTLNFDTISNHLNYNNVYFINLKTFFTYIFGI